MRRKLRRENQKIAKLWILVNVFVRMCLIISLLHLVVGWLRRKQAVVPLCPIKPRIKLLCRCQGIGD